MNAIALTVKSRSGVDYAQLHSSRTVAPLIARNNGHAGYEISPARRDGRPLLDLMTTPTHHDLHHQKVAYNYGLYFTWWDRWMATEHPDYHHRFAETSGAVPPAAAAAN